MNPVIRALFPILTQKVHGKQLVYLDSAASAQKPNAVLDAMDAFTKTSYANVHRGIHHLAEEATAAYEHAREQVATFLNATPGEIVFTSGTTAGINLVARSVLSTLSPGDEILVSALEHHSNFVPWQQLAKQHNLTLRVLTLTPDFTIDMDVARTLITQKTKLVAIAHVSNVLGTINPVAEITRLAHEHGALVLVDGAQAVAHMPVDVQQLDVDFYVFSGHKLYGPTGVGVLYGKRALLERMQPVSYGGEMVGEVTIEKTTWNDIPFKFEPGTPNIIGVIGLVSAVQFVKQLGWERIMQHEHALIVHAIVALRDVPGLSIIGPNSAEGRCGVFSFTLDGVHPHDVAAFLDLRGIAVRAGHHCAQPLHCTLGLTATTRASFGVYTTLEEIDALCTALRDVRGAL